MYRRGSIWWVTYPGPGGRRVRESSGETDRRRAERFERQRKASVAAGTWQPMASAQAVTIARWAEAWIARQHDRKLRTAHDTETRIRMHVLPKLGKWPIAELRPKHVIAFVRELEAGELAPRTVIHVYDALRGMMRDAQIEELIVASPCVLPPGTLPKKKDADPTWRAGAVFTRPEIETLISDERVPLDRRTYYALIFFAGLRHGEAAGRRWRDLDTTMRPLGSLTVATQVDGTTGKDRETKTETPRIVPVHPTLAAILAEWRLSGFGMYLGRSPRPEDWIVPSRRGRHRSVRHTLRRLHEDLERLGLRARRTHDLRRTMISLARADGARADVLSVVTHGPSGDIIDLYTSWPWAALCEAVSSLRIDRRGTTDVGHIDGHIEGAEEKSPMNQGALWRSGRDSKPRR